MSYRADALADRIEQGAQALAALAESLSDAEWQTVVPNEGRTVGVLIHHVASVYPVEVDAAKGMAAGQPIVGFTWEMVAQMNPAHARTSRREQGRDAQSAAPEQQARGRPGARLHR